MHEKMPSFDRRAGWLTYVFPSMPPFQDDAPPAATLRSPLPPEDAIARLDDAKDPAEWFHIAREQLDAEAAQHAADRAVRLGKHTPVP